MSLLATVVAHPVLLSVCAFVVYESASWLHTWSKAGLTIKSDSAVASLRQYIGIYWPKLMWQWVLGIALFLFVWNNDAVANLLQLPNLGDKVTVKLGIQIVFGWFSDSVIDKVLALLKIGVRVPKTPDPAEDTQ